MPDACVDSIVTDPPYELTTGKKSSGGFMGKSWDATGIAYSVEMWSEALRILKPGGHLLAFGATRTYHRMACAIEDAGFEIRDSIHWIYSSGFPKSHNVAIAIDKSLGAMEHRGQRVSVAGNRNQGGENIPNATSVPKHEPVTPEAQQWDGWGTALKPAHEPVVVARKPLSEKNVAANVMRWGTGALNIDASRIGSSGGTSRNGQSTHLSPSGAFTTGHDIAQINAGRWPANIIFGHNDDCEQIGVVEETVVINHLEKWSGFGQEQKPDYESSSSKVTSPAWRCTPGCSVAELDEQSGTSKSGTAIKRNLPQTGASQNIGFKAPTQRGEDVGYGDSGGASRFFYVAKASKKERNAGLEHLDPQFAPTLRPGVGAVEHTPENATPKHNIHPTVKPVELMRYLVKMVTPPGGIVFDPFLGSGTTAVAAILEGFKWIGCEMTDDYYPIIEGRVEWAQSQNDLTAP